MKIRDQEFGNALELVTPAGGVSSGDGKMVGALFGVATGDYDAAEVGTYLTEGVFTMPKESTADFSAGDEIYWDDTAGEWDESAAGRFPAGTCVEDAAAATTSVKVKLNGNATTVVP